MMNVPRFFALHFLLVALLGSSFGNAQAEDRLPIAGKINNQQVESAFDTGADASFLFRSVAERLGLRIRMLNDKDPLPTGRVRYDIAEGCMVDLGHGAYKTDIAVIDDPPGGRLPFDGVIPWTTASNYIFQLDLERGIYKFPDELPPEAKDWTRWQMVPDTGVVMFESSSGKESIRIGLDRGVQTAFC
jgi:Aspartyl protease